MTTPNRPPFTVLPAALLTPRGPCAIALLCAALCHGAVQARTPRAPKAASAPSTEQILAPSRATVPDALPSGAPVWRCGNSYSERPCAQPGTAPVDVADARTDAQRRQSEEVAARDQRLAAWYEAGRRQRETVASAPAGRRAAASAACAQTSCRPKTPRFRRAVIKKP